jgi:hypothetical protein
MGEVRKWRKYEIAGVEASDSICILGNRGLPNLYHIVEVMNHKMELSYGSSGSKKLSNFLPNIYLSRHFDVFEKCDKLIADCWLLSDNSVEASALLSCVLGSKSVIIYKLDHGIKALNRSWAYVSVLDSDKAMTNAVKRRNSYKAAASVNYTPSR